MSKGVAGGLQRLMHLFLPKEEDFFRLFAEMSDEAYEAAKLLQSLFHGEATADELVPGIEEIEHRGDRLRRDCVQRLNDTFVTPIMFDRQDILDLADALDDIIDFTRAAIDRIALYRVRTMPEAAVGLSDILVRCTEALRAGCHELNAVRSWDSSFIQQVNTLEDEGDHILKRGLAELFLHEADPVEIIKWKEIYDYVEEAVDRCEETAHVIEAALVKNS